MLPMMVAPQGHMQRMSMVMLVAVSQQSAEYQTLYQSGHASQHADNLAECTVPSGATNWWHGVEVISAHLLVGVHRRSCIVPDTL